MRRALATAAAAIMALMPAASSAEDLTGTLKKIKDSGAITLGYRDSSVPFSYLGGDQKPIGFAMDICYKIVDAVKQKLAMPNLEMKLNPVTSATRIPLMANGTIDLECGSTTNNVERERQVSFTNSHFLSASIYVAKKSSNLHTIDDLKGKTVVSTSGTTNLKQVLEANTARNLGMTVLTAPDHAAAFLMVETGRAAAFVMDDVLIAALVAGSKNPGDYALSTDAFSKAEPYGIMLRKDDPEFQKVADDATAKLYKSPDGKALYDKWFTKPIPPRGINLNLPMTPAMVKQFANPQRSPDPAAY